MSISAQPDVAPPQKLSIVAAFQAAPTLVKILAGSFYLGALLMIAYAVMAATGLGMVASAQDDGVLGMGVAVVLALFLLMALVGFLLGKGIARGARGTWVLTLVLVVIALPSYFLVGGVTVGSIVGVVIAVATLTLLLTPVVRQHCTKK